MLVNKVLLRVWMLFPLNAFIFCCASQERDYLPQIEKLVLSYQDWMVIFLELYANAAAAESFAEPINVACVRGWYFPQCVLPLIR